MFGRELRTQREEGESRLTGFGVEAIDGPIGTIDAATHCTHASLIVVDTGPWIFGRKVMLPAGVVDRIDADGLRVFVHRTKDEIRRAPEYDDAMPADMTYRDRLQASYGRNGAGHREWDTRGHPLSRR